MARRGFTLIEIAVALVIVGLMTAVLLPVVADRLTSARASQMAVQLDNVRDAARTFYLDVGHWPGALSQLADEPGTGLADTRDLFGDTIRAGAASAWRGPYLNVSALPGDSLDMGRHGVLVSPFGVLPWSGSEFFTLPVHGVSLDHARRVSEVVDGDTTLAIDDLRAGRIRWDDGVLLYLAEPVRR